MSTAPAPQVMNERAIAAHYRERAAHLVEILRHPNVASALASNAQDPVFAERKALVQEVLQRKIDEIQVDAAKKPASLPAWEMCFRLAVLPESSLDRFALLFEGGKYFYAELEKLFADDPRRDEKIERLARERAELLNTNPTLAGKIEVRVVVAGSLYDSFEHQLETPDPESGSRIRPISFAVADLRDGTEKKVHKPALVIPASKTAVP